MNIYGTAADTIIHCYCIDDEANDGQGAQQAPPLLKAFITDHPRKLPLHQRLLGGGNEKETS